MICVDYVKPNHSEANPPFLCLTDRLCDGTGQHVCVLCTQRNWELHLSMYRLSVRKYANRFARHAKNIFCSTLSNEIVLNWLPFLEFHSFDIDIPLGSFHDSGTTPVPQATFRSLHNRLYLMELGPDRRFLDDVLHHSKRWSSCFSGTFASSILSIP